MSKKDTKGLSVKKENLVDWYSEVLQKAELADYAPIKGFMIIRPNAYAIWESIQKEFDKFLIKEKVDNAYFPLLIPKSFFTKEAEHAKGFAPELAYIEGTGEENEGDKLAIRPTSETIMYDSYSKWIRSWRDLPLKLNQWSNTLRWEVKQTKPFLRTREFLWQEGHCAFATEKEAIANQEIVMNEYRRLAKDLLALPSLTGKKSKMETFAGSKDSLTFEMLMPDGKALQAGTSHNLGQNFAKAFNVKFKDKDEKENYVWQTSWGISTRLIGAVAMVHGDDKGLILPPRVAKNPVVIVPILFEDSRKKVLAKAYSILADLKEINCFVDDRDYNPGWKFNEWEMKGIPIRIEIGPKDLESKKVTIVRRDTGEKEQVAESKIKKRVLELLDEIHDNIYNKAKKFLDSRIVEADSLQDLKKQLDKGMIVKVGFTNSIEVEEKIKEKTGATSRFIVSGKSKCVISGKSTDTIGYFANSY